MRRGEEEVGVVGARETRIQLEQLLQRCFGLLPFLFSDELSCQVRKRPEVSGIFFDQLGKSRGTLVRVDRLELLPVQSGCEALGAFAGERGKTLLKLADRLGMGGD